MRNQWISEVGLSENSGKQLKQTSVSWSTGFDQVLDLVKYGYESLTPDMLHICSIYTIVYLQFSGGFSGHGADPRTVATVAVRMGETMPRQDIELQEFHTRFSPC